MKKQWTDEHGVEIPANRIKNSEKLKEKWSKKIKGKAEKTSKDLLEIKMMMISAAEEISSAVCQEAGVDPKKTKGNFIWYDFDRNTRHDCSISDRIEFDSLLMEAAQVKLDEYVKEQGIDSRTPLSVIIKDAFTKKNGSVDTKKVFGLLSYKSRFNSKEPENRLFFEGLELIEQSIRRPSSKAYYRVAVKDAQGEYKNIELNISSI